MTCGHELASDLNGPKRAVTAVLNARLVGMIAALIQATETIKLIAGIGETLTGRVVLVDATTLDIRTLRLRRDPACPAICRCFRRGWM